MTSRLSQSIRIVALMTFVLSVYLYFTGRPSDALFFSNTGFQLLALSYWYELRCVKRQAKKKNGLISPETFDKISKKQRGYYFASLRGFNKQE